MESVKNSAIQEKEKKEYTCRMFLGKKFYDELKEEGKELFEATPEGFCASFHAIFEEGITLGNCVMSFCEVAYIGFHPKYQIEEDTEVTCELYKTGKQDKTFSILVTIRYPGDKEPHHELLVFAQRELTDYRYSFELIGDQAMFAIT